MTEPRCTCGPSILDPECPVRGHQEELERSADPFAYEERMGAVEQIRRVLDPPAHVRSLLDAIAEGRTTILVPRRRLTFEGLAVDEGEPIDGGCE
jgi:hypothetical protein